MSKKQVSVYNPKEAPANIQQPYSFTRQLLGFEYNIHELRILFRILELIKTHQIRNKGVQIDIDNNVTLQFPVQAFMVPGHKNNGEIRSALIALREKTISKEVLMEVFSDGETKTVKAEQFLGLIEKPTYTYNNSFVELKLNDSWFSYLSDLTKGYTQFASNIAFNCSSTETVKLYQFINHWFKNKGKTLKISSFKKEFNIGKGYSISKIVDRFLEPSKNELDRIGDRSFNYVFFYSDGNTRDPKNPIKGKIVSKITFTFYTNTKNVDKFALSDFDHKEATKWLKRIKPRYNLTNIEVSMLYGTIQRHSYAYIFSLEKDYRKILKKLEGMEILSELSKFIGIENKKRNIE